MCLGVFAYEYVLMNIGTQISTQIHTQTHTHTHMRACMRVAVRVCVCVLMHARRQRTAAAALASDERPDYFCLHYLPYLFLLPPVSGEAPAQFAERVREVMAASLQASRFLFCFF